MAQAYLIREALRADAGVLAGIVREAFEEYAVTFGVTRQNYPTFPSFCQADWIEADFDMGRRLFILEADGAPAGCIGMRPLDDGVCELIRLAVIPTRRHRGFGEALVNHVFLLARSQGLRSVTLGMVASNALLLQWYERLGFAVTDRRRPAHLPFETASMTITLSAEAKP